MHGERCQDIFDAMQIQLSHPLQWGPTAISSHYNFDPLQFSAIF